MPKGRPALSSASQPSTSRSSQPSTSRSSQPSTSRSFSNSQASQSQTQQIQAEKAAATLNQGEITKKVDELVQYLLIMDQKKVPIKKQDMNKMVLKEASRALPIILKKASQRLKEVFGIEVVELQEKLKGSYILINTVDKPLHLMTWPETDNARMGLLTVILSIVYMSGGVIQDGDLWHGLKGLGIDPHRGHDTFGDVKKLVTQEFVKQAYLELTKLSNTEHPVFEVRWGQRAFLETSKMQILKFVSMLYGRDPEQWTTRYREARDDIDSEQSADV